MNQAEAAPRGSPLEVFLAFLRLGLTSFGGPIAHLGYFREAFVVRRRWLDEAAYADIVALCQFLPGPASSQVGLTLGLIRAGPLGALAAWLGFTLPSAVLMTLFALGASALAGPRLTGLVHGLKLVAVAVVAQAVLGMARSLAPDARRAAIAATAVAILVLTPAAFGQVLALALGAAAGLLFCRQPAATATPASTGSPRLPRAVAWASLAAYLALLLAGPVLAATTQSPLVAMLDAFYRSGALVFGGGHVVLPLLQATVVDPGWVAPDRFLAGYGAAQAMPGPLFTFAAYLGAVAPAPLGGPAGAALALAAIFLPGVLALLAALPYWADLRRQPAAQAALRGANAAVVGILALALYDPLWTSTVRTPVDFALGLAGFVLLVAARAPPILVVGLGLVAGLLLPAA